MTPKTLENSHFWQKGSAIMARPSLAEKDILNPSEAISLSNYSRKMEKATVPFIPSGECCDQPFRWRWMMTFW